MRTLIVLLIAAFTAACAQMPSYTPGRDAPAQVNAGKTCVFPLQWQWLATEKQWVCGPIVTVALPHLRNTCTSADFWGPGFSGSSTTCRDHNGVVVLERTCFNHAIAWRRGFSSSHSSCEVTVPKKP
ncbi:MAG: hypothetical protein AAB442_01105 [Patescibacteria group bacterium]